MVDDNKLLGSSDISATDTQRKYDLPLCSGKIKKHYHIEELEPSSVEDKILQQVKVDVSLPFDRFKQIEAFMCCMKKNVYTSISTKECLYIEETVQCPFH